MDTNGPIVWTDSTRRLSELIPWPRNPRKIKDESAKRLQDSFEEFGQPEPVVIGPNNELYNGHQRLKSWMKKFGDVDVAVRVASRALAEKEREKLTVYLHKGAAGEWDFEMLATEFSAPDLVAWGFEPGELGLDDVLSSPLEDPGAQVDRAEELREKWGVSPGQLWQLGAHRLICGDCTDAAVVGRVMGGEKANGAFTSPPYAMQRKDTYGGTPTDKYVDWWEGVQSAVRSVLAADGSFFVNIKPHCEDGERVLYVFDLVLAMRRRWGWKYVDELYWKTAGVPGLFKGRFRNVIEPVFHFAASEIWKWYPRPDGQKVGNRVGKGYSPTNSGIQSDFEYTGDALPTNCIEIASAGHETKDAFNLHSAMFPIGLPSFFIKAYSATGDIWLEPFSGSGTTIIACEQLSRGCRAIEIAPGYVAVALERWAKATGNTPMLA